MFFFRSPDFCRTRWMGMSTGTIPDGSITSSSGLRNSVPVLALVLILNVVFRSLDFCRTRRMGMSTRVIPDDSVTSATPYDHRFVAANGRFGTNRSWLARSMNMDAVWLKVDLGQESRVYGVITQGRPDYGQWARTYKLSFSMDGGNWTTYADTDGSDKLFQGNYDRSSPVYNFLDSPVTTRHVQFHPRTYQSRPVMRVEVLGCPTELL
ncbi:lactadherin-like isoform X2 [Branchiostoma lanceolatum]|uniref:lactadherin-like isoform X1 n=1 Tax=Branchiostoma lanceolatum TaxID=7740 RepID=UPI003453E65B